VIEAYEHVGIRLTDRARALAFYGALGLRVIRELPDHDALELPNDAGVAINLILNGRGAER